MEADKVTVATGGASTAKVNSKSAINATSSGASSISFKGDPTDKSIEASGASSINKWSGDDTQSSTNTNGDTTKMHMGKNDIMIYGNGDHDHEHHHNHGNFEYWSGIEKKKKKKKI